MNKFNATFTILTILIAIIGHAATNPLSRHPEGEETEKCKDICNECNCIGFYCGDECICECNNDKDENLNCVESMQNNCEKFNLPFEVLIQGPSGNRFVRSLMSADESASKLEEPTDSKVRSSISIYQPSENNERIAREAEKLIEEAEKVAEEAPELVATSTTEVAQQSERKSDTQSKREITLESLGERELMKRDTDEIANDPAADIVNPSAKPATTTEPNVGSILLPGLIAPKLLGLKARIQAAKLATAATIPAKIAAAKAALIGKFGLVSPILPLIPPIPII